MPELGVAHSIFGKRPRFYFYKFSNARTFFKVHKVNPKYSSPSDKSQIKKIVVGYMRSKKFSRL